MITLKDVKKAMKMIENPVEYLQCKALHKQLVRSLEVYENRDEFDGTLDSAVACLELAGYEIEKNAVIALSDDEEESDTEV